MLDRLDPETLLIQHLDWVDNVAALVCRRNGLWGHDADDFAASARLKLVQDAVKTAHDNAADEMRRAIGSHALTIRAKNDAQRSAVLAGH